MEDELEDIKRSLNLMLQEISTTSKDQRKIMDLMKNEELKRLNDEKDKLISLVETRVANMGQFSRINDVIITGLDINTYDRAVASVGEPTESELDSTEGITELDRPPSNP